MGREAAGQVQHNAQRRAPPARIERSSLRPFTIGKPVSSSLVPCPFTGRSTAGKHSIEGGKYVFRRAARRDARRPWRDARRSWREFVRVSCCWLAYRGCQIIFLFPWLPSRDFTSPPIHKTFLDSRKERIGRKCPRLMVCPLSFVSRQPPHWQSPMHRGPPMPGVLAASRRVIIAAVITGERSMKRS